MSKVKHFFAMCLAAILVTSCLITVSPSQVSAVNPTHGHRMTGGISDVYVYIDDKSYPQATYWQNLIKAAINNWMYTGVGANNFYCRGYVSSGVSGSKIDFYSHPSQYFGELSDRELASTAYLDYNIHYVDYRQSDWYSARIDINDPLLRQDRFSNDDAIGAFVHEIGHAFGLADNYYQNSIMYYNLDGCNVRRVQKSDNDTLNSLY